MLFKIIVLAVIFECVTAAIPALIPAAIPAKKVTHPSTAAAKLVTEEEFRAPIDKGYKLEYSFKANWYTAYLFCRYHDLQLATIETKEQQAFVTKLIKDYGLTAESFWLSGTDLGQESRFSWFSTGKPFKYTNWSSGQPDNFQANENCLHLWGNQQWNDVACSSQYYFICEKPVINCCLNKH